MSLSIWQIAIVAVLVVLLFGRGRISGVMGDVAKGIKTFKKGVADDDEADAPAKRLPASGEDAMVDPQRSTETGTPRP